MGSPYSEVVCARLLEVVLVFHCDERKPSMQVWRAHGNFNVGNRIYA